MKPNTPFFADLSTYHPQQTISFYKNVFGWKFYNENNYYTAFLGNQAVVGLYETPDKFKQMRMPHFWMTYIQVNNASDTVAKAQQLGGIIEMQDEIPYFGKVALIRDPQGAGFTIYEGNQFDSTRTKDTPNTLIWNELHVSDLSAVVSFYTGIFNWRLDMIDNEHIRVFNHLGEHITDMIESPNEYKGKYEYWISCFRVENLELSKKKILQHGGQLIVDEGYRMLFTDNSEQAFFYIQNE